MVSRLEFLKATLTELRRSKREIEDKINLYESEIRKLEQRK
jgi:hypothetical protein